MSVDKNEVLRKFIHVDRYHHRLLDNSVSKVGLHRAQYGVLFHLLHFEGTQKQLAECFDISSAAMANILKKLECLGYITKISQKDDARCNVLSLTDSGRSVLEKSKALAQQVDENMFIGFSDDELEVFLNCLNKIQKNLNDFEQGEKNEKMD